MNRALKCDMTQECDKPVSHIDEKGFIYCRECGIRRKNSARCRQLKKKELKKIVGGQPLERY